MISKRLAVICVIFAAMVAGCDSSPDDRSETSADQRGYEPPAQVKNFSFHWTADSAVDLFSTSAVILRAYLESYDLAWISQDTAAFYPGFDSAVPQNDLTNTQGSLGAVRPIMNLAASVPRPSTFGTEYLHILRLDSTVEQQTAVVCSDLRRLSQLNPEQGGYPAWYQTFAMALNSMGRGDTNYQSRESISVIRVTFSEVESKSGPTERQEGTRPAPRENVFGGWRITGRDVYTDSSWSAPRWKTAKDDLNACAAVFPRLGVDYFKRIDKPLFATEPPMPGWPV